MHPRAIGQAQAGQTSEAQLTELQMVANRLDELMNFACHQCERIEGIDGRLTGGAPTVEPKPGPAAVPAGLVGLLNAKIDEIIARLQRTDAVVSRINSAV